jgi:hypothetical protein
MRAEAMNMNSIGVEHLTELKRSEASGAACIDPSAAATGNVRSREAVLGWTRITPLADC